MVCPVFLVSWFNKTKQLAPIHNLFHTAWPSGFTAHLKDSIQRESNVPMLMDTAPPAAFTLLMALRFATMAKWYEKKIGKMDDEGLGGGNWLNIDD